MNIGWRHLTGSATNTDGTTYGLSVTPNAADNPLLAIVAQRYSVAPAMPTLAGTNGVINAWVQVGDSVTVGVIRLTLFRSTAASTTAGTLTATSANTELAWGMVVWEVSNVAAAV